MWKVSKYHNRRSNGFDSTAEQTRWYELSLLESKGAIQGLQRQVKYTLIPAQYIDGKCVERAVTYKADFVYQENGETIVEDVKGFKTKEYIIKRKLMLYIHGIKIREV